MLKDDLNNLAVNPCINLLSEIEFCTNIELDTKIDDYIKQFIDENESTMKYIVYYLSKMYDIDRRRHYIYLYTYPISELFAIRYVLATELIELLQLDLLTVDDLDLISPVYLELINMDMKIDYGFYIKSNLIISKLIRYNKINSLVEDIFFSPVFQKYIIIS